MPINRSMPVTGELARSGSGSGDNNLSYIKKDISFNDYTELSTIQTYLMYIDIENSVTGSIQKSFIRGLRVLVTNDEKTEFQTKFPEITNFPNIMYPVVDTWSPHTQQMMFMRLTEDCEKAAFNFTTGMGFINFSNNTQ